MFIYISPNTDVLLGNTYKQVQCVIKEVVRLKITYLLKQKYYLLVFYFYNAFDNSYETLFIVKKCSSNA